MSGENGKVRGPSPTVTVEILCNLATGDQTISGPTDLLLLSRILVSALRAITDRMAGMQQQAAQQRAPGIQVASERMLRLLPPPEAPKGEKP